MFTSQSVKLISDNIWIGLVLWHRLNEVRDFDKNLTQPEIWVNRVRDNESQLYIIVRTNYIWWDEDDVQFVLDQHA
jgi:hypothetical protein